MLFPLQEGLLWMKELKTKNLVRIRREYEGLIKGRSILKSDLKRLRVDIRKKYGIKDEKGAEERFIECRKEHRGISRELEGLEGEIMEMIENMEYK